MDAPYYQVWLVESGRNISNLVSSFTYEDCLEKDDLVKFTLSGSGSDIVNIVDGGTIVKGTEIKFIFGFKGGKTSSTGIGIIQNTKVKYGTTDTMTVEAFDKGPEMKKFPSNKIWTGMTNSEIAEGIASKNKMTAVVEPTKRVRFNICQGNLDDFEFMKQVEEHARGYIFYITGTTLYFVSRDSKLRTPPVRAYTRGYSDILGFVTEFKESTQDGTSEQVTITKIDPITKEVKVTSINDKNVEAAVLGGNTLNINKFAGDEDKKDAVPEDTGKFLPGVPTEEVEEDEDVAASIKQSSDMDKMTATLDIEMNPTIKAGDLVTTKGFAQRDNGNWIVTQATHKPASSATTMLKLKKNAANKAVVANSNKTDKDKQNTAVGPPIMLANVQVKTKAP